MPSKYRKSKGEDKLFLVRLKRYSIVSCSIVEVRRFDTNHRETKEFFNNLLARHVVFLEDLMVGILESIEWQVLWVYSIGDIKYISEATMSFIMEPANIIFHWNFSIIRYWKTVISKKCIFCPYFLIRAILELIISCIFWLRGLAYPRCAMIYIYRRVSIVQTCTFRWKRIIFISFMR